MDDFEGVDAMVKLRDIAKTLCFNAIGENEVNVENLLPDSDSFQLSEKCGETEIMSWAQRYPSELGYELFFVLSR